MKMAADGFVSYVQTWAFNVKRKKMQQQLRSEDAEIDGQDGVEGLIFKIKAEIVYLNSYKL